MRNFANFLFVLAAQSLLTKSQTFDNKTVYCEQIKVQLQFLGFLQTCIMNNTTTIDRDDYQLGFIENQIFEVLSFSFNDEIEYLPKAHREISNLKIYDAAFCSIKKIFYENFEGLKDLSILMLCWNEIEIIPRKTFCDLTSLTELYLRKRKKIIE
jgi:hypothetical protein